MGLKFNMDVLVVAEIGFHFMVDEDILVGCKVRSELMVRVCGFVEGLTFSNVCDTHFLALFASPIQHDILADSVERDVHVDILRQVVATQVCLHGVCHSFDLQIRKSRNTG